MPAMTLTNHPIGRKVKGSRMSPQAALANVPRLSERESSQGHTGARATTSKVLWVLKTVRAQKQVLSPRELFS